MLGGVISQYCLLVGEQIDMAAQNVEVAESSSASAAQSLKKGAEYEIARRKKIVIIVIIIVVVILVIGNFSAVLVCCGCLRFLILHHSCNHHSMGMHDGSLVRQMQVREQKNKTSQWVWCGEP